MQNAKQHPAVWWGVVLFMGRMKNKNKIKDLRSLQQQLKKEELWASLSAEEKEELMTAYEESFDEENFIDHQ